MSGQGRKGSKRNATGRKGRHGREHVKERLEQPIAESAGAVQCDLCGHPVDPKRMHFHKVRFHGATFRSKQG